MDYAYTLNLPLTMDTLCRLKPLLHGLSPAVLRGIHWSEISGTTHCQCWSTLLADLKPAHRAMLHRALQEVWCSCFSVGRLLSPLCQTVLYSSFPVALHCLSYHTESR